VSRRCRANVKRKWILSREQGAGVRKRAGLTVRGKLGRSLGKYSRSGIAELTEHGQADLVLLVLNDRSFFCYVDNDLLLAQRILDGKLGSAR
jgi:hypothetical protein